MCRLHIVYGESGAATLRLALSDLGHSDSVVAFPEVLQYAPLFPDFSDRAIGEYAECYCRLMRIEREDDKAQLRNAILQFVRSDFSSYDEVVLWCGDKVGDRLFNYMCCELIDRPFCKVDISRLRDVLPNPNVARLSMSICSVDNIKYLLDYIVLVVASDVECNRKQWQQWSCSRVSLRGEDSNGDIVGLSEDVFDELILSACSNDWLPAARVVGGVLCQIGFAVGDSFLHHRIVELAKARRINVRTNERFVSLDGIIEGQSANPDVMDGICVGELRLFDIKS